MMVCNLCIRIFHSSSHIRTVNKHLEWSPTAQCLVKAPTRSKSLPFSLERVLAYTSLRWWYWLPLSELSGSARKGDEADITSLKTVKQLCWLDHSSFATQAFMHNT